MKTLTDSEYNEMQKELEDIIESSETCIGSGGNGDPMQFVIQPHNAAENVMKWLEQKKLIRLTSNN